LTALTDREENIKYRVAFSYIPGIGRVRLARLENHFGSLEAAWKASPAALTGAGLEAKVIQEVEFKRPGISPEAEMEKLERAGIQALSPDSKGYPTRLKEIYDHPPLLYVKGNLQPDEWSLAVVGTRRPTVYGRQLTEELVADLVRQNLTIVSGLARGVDSIAHNAALEAGGRSLAVLGCGVDVIYPSENAALAGRLVENGALISEHPPGTRPRPEYFPRRNRIISGLSLGVLITEAGEDSGALITASRALEQNREVFAVPGSVLSPQSAGCNRLIQEGAKLVRDHRDILEELNLTAMGHQAQMKELIPATEEEAQLLGCLTAEPSHIDEVCRLSHLPMATVSSTLAMMELKGMVKQVGSLNYSLARELREIYRVGIE